MVKPFLDLVKKIASISNPVSIIRNLWSNGFLIQEMISRDLSQRYKGSYLGLIWSAINPLFMLVVYTFVFGVIFKSRWRPNSSDPIGEFALTMYAGLIAFNFISEILLRSPTIVIQFPNYVKKVVFPLEILVIVITGTALINSLISLVILLLGSLVLFGTIPATIIFLPLIYIPMIFLALGAGWTLASLGVYIRDIGQVMTIVTQILFFVTPIFYSPSSIPSQFNFFVSINPLAVIINDFRKILIWSELFSIKEWAFWTFIFAILAILGYTWFMGTKKGFADVL